MSSSKKKLSINDISRDHILSLLKKGYLPIIYRNPGGKPRQIEFLDKKDSYETAIIFSNEEYTSYALSFIDRIIKER